MKSMGLQVKSSGIGIVRCLTILLAAMAFGFLTFPGQTAHGASLGSMVGQTYYLKCNLHPDPRNNRLSSVNYQVPGGLLKWGTKVKILKAKKKKVIFQDVETGIEYTYEIHKRTLRATTAAKHLEKILTKDISGLKKHVARLSSTDKEGINEGRALVGMTKAGVLVAIGYPPEFATPNPMKTSKWHYWYNRWGQFFLQFNNKGRLQQIIGHY